MTLDNLTPNDVQLIITALLFSSSPDITGEWTEEETLDMIDVAVKIKRKAEITPNPLDVKALKIKIAKETCCDNLTKVRLITDYFDLKEF